MAVTGILILLGMLAGLLGYHNFRDLALVIATVVVGIPIAIKAFQALRLKVFSIELLVTIAVIGALIIGEYIESAVVAFLFLFGDYLEGRSLKKTRSALKDLIDMAPQEATVVRDGGQVTIPMDDVVEGDRVIIRSGEKIPADGTIVSGNATLNESTITGESVPVSKIAGDRVFSGTIVDNGYLEVMADRVGDDTTFARIIELVEEAQETKSKREKFLDRFASIYTPAVILIAAIVFILTYDLHLAITFLVIACPGALVIGAPVSNVAGIGNGARNGILIKGGQVMDNLARIDTVVFDKTGTLTKGNPEVAVIKIFNGMKTDELLRLVAEAETISEHHLGQTIVKAAKSRGLILKGLAEQGEVIKGKGIHAVVEGHVLVVGNKKLMAEVSISLPESVMGYVIQQQKLGSTAVLVAMDGQIAGVISIVDQIREDAHQALAEMRKNGIKKMVMLTGDNKHAAGIVASELELDAFHAELLPENKVEFVKSLKAEGRVVAMAGDGINDAPAIATADIGLAMGVGGTDISMETADVVLMADKLTKFSHAYSLAKATIRNIKQNTWFAVAVSLLLIAGVFAGNVHMASGMFIHVASVLLVILNATRLIGFNSKDPLPEKIYPSSEDV